MKLNHLKCAFQVSFGKFQGYMLNYERIEVNLEKIWEIIKTKEPKRPKEIRSLMGRIAILCRCISKYI